MEGTALQFPAFGRYKVTDMSALGEFYKNFIIGDIKNTEEEPDVDEWMEFLASLPEPKDCIDEAYNKYLCRLQYVPKKKTVLLNTAAFAVLAATLPRVMRSGKPLPKKQGKKLLLEKKKDVDYTDVLPPELPGEYDEFLPVDQTKAKIGDLSKEALSLYKAAVRRHPTEFYFQLFLLKELSNHSRYIRTYNPSATAVYINERNVAGPVLTRMYEKTGRKLISFMHGEYLLQMIQAYMNFSEFYVWDEMYIDMFRKDLHCGIKKYIVTTPLKLTKKWHLEDIEPEIWCTYYFSGESTASVKRLAAAFKKAARDDRRYMVRPHPRYSHQDLIREYFPADMIEDPKEVSMEESMARTANCAGLHTTVLSEAQVEGRCAVIDDISDPEQFRNLERRKFVVLQRPHKLLSEIIG